MTRPMVYVTKPLSQDVLARLGEVCEVRSWPGPGRCSVEVLEREAAAVQAILGTDNWTAAMLEKAGRLRHIALTSVGFDMVDLGAATARGILVTNTPDVLTETVADLTFALILAAARRLGETERWMRAGQWRTLGVTPMGRDVHHATLGIVGLGRIGAAVAERAKGFRMPILYTDFVRREDLERELGCRFVDLETLLATSDFVTIHVPLLPETRGMIGAAQFARMKPTAYLINAARGPVVDERALIAALQAGRIAGAGLDVYETEPPDMQNPLLGMENVITLPHVGSATAATRQAMVDLAADNLLAVVQGKPPVTPVNPEVLAHLKP
jgi:glyoxylate reductase